MCDDVMEEGFCLLKRDSNEKELDKLWVDVHNIPVQSRTDDDSALDHECIVSLCLPCVEGIVQY